MKSQCLPNTTHYLELPVLQQRTVLNNSMKKQASCKVRGTGIRMINYCRLLLRGFLDDRKLTCALLPYVCLGCVLIVCAIKSQACKYPEAEHTAKYSTGPPHPLLLPELLSCHPVNILGKQTGHKDEAINSMFCNLNQIYCCL